MLELLGYQFIVFRPLLACVFLHCLSRHKEEERGAREEGNVIEGSLEV
jgi:hypothetical protein